MNMMISFNGCERDFDGWMSLFKKADPNLGLRNMWTPSGSALSVLELALGESEIAVGPV